MPNYKASNKLQRIGDYEATGAESSKTFTFAAVTFDDDAYLMLVIDLGGTAALNLLLEIAGDSSSNYYVDGNRTTGGATTIIDINTATSAQICSNVMIDGANSNATIICYIQLSKAISQGVSIKSFATSSTLRATEYTLGMLGQNKTSIAQLIVKTSTSTWQTGTRMTLYKLKR